MLHFIRYYGLSVIVFATIMSMPIYFIYSIVTYVPEPLQESSEEFPIVRVFKNGKYYSFQTIDANKKIIDHHFYDIEVFADVAKDKPMWAKVIKQSDSKYVRSSRAEVHIHDPSELDGGSYTERVHKHNETFNSQVIE